MALERSGLESRVAKQGKGIELAVPEVITVTTDS
jgi:hypothetical protein